MKRDFPPTTPYREKQRVKKDKTGVSLKPSKTARAREDVELASFVLARPADCARTPDARKRTRYHEAGAAADELIEILGGNHERDHGIWAFYCYHFNIEDIIEAAHRIKSEWQQHEFRDPITKFQRWLQESFPKEAL